MATYQPKSNERDSVHRLLKILHVRQKGLSDKFGVPQSTLSEAIRSDGKGALREEAWDKIIADLGYEAERQQRDLEKSGSWASVKRDIEALLNRSAMPGTRLEISGRPLNSSSSNYVFREPDDMYKKIANGSAAVALIIGGQKSGRTSFLSRLKDFADRENIPHIMINLAASITSTEKLSYGDMVLALVAAINPKQYEKFENVPGPVLTPLFEEFLQEFAMSKRKGAHMPILAFENFSLLDEYADTRRAFVSVFLTVTRAFAMGGAQIVFTVFPPTTFDLEESQVWAQSADAILRPLRRSEIIALSDVWSEDFKDCGAIPLSDNEADMWLNKVGGNPDIIQALLQDIAEKRCDSASGAVSQLFDHLPSVFGDGPDKPTTRRVQHHFKAFRSFFDRLRVGRGERKTNQLLEAICSINSHTLMQEIPAFESRSLDLLGLWKREANVPELYKIFAKQILDTSGGGDEID